MAEIDNKILIGLIAALTGVYGWLLKHLSNSNKHPCKDDIVFRDVCDERSKRLEDCLEGAEKRTEQRFQEVKTDMKDGFGRIEKLINGRK